MSLPRILAGPIVRRVEPGLCSVWMALSESARVRVTLYEGAQFATDQPGLVASGDSPIAVDSEQTRRFGERLHVAVVAIPVSGTLLPLLPGQTYSYDVDLEGAFGTSDLRREGLLKDEAEDARIPGVDESAPLHLALGYLEDRLPSFILPGATLESLRIVHTSCRRPGAPLHDALSWLDDIVRDTLDDAAERPQQLYLTGDQIYADDVADVMLPMLTELGRELVGPDESIPVAGEPIPGTITNFPSARRSKVLRLEARLSTASSANHLITFGEFAAMYLTVWSSRAWRKLASPDEVFVDATPGPGMTELVTRWEACDKFGSLEKWRAAHEPGVRSEEENTARFRDLVPRVARVLANVPTYMIFDDHEITDDWNISQRWVNRVYSNDLGVTVLRNGLMAYGIFQGWGNDPLAFRTGNNEAFLKETADHLKGPTEVPSAPTVDLDRLLGLSERKPEKQVKWHYQVPGALHHTVVLDTRTRRSFRGQGHAPPDLLGGSLKDQLPAGPLAGGRELLVLVSAVPVVAPQAIDRIGQPLAAIAQDFKVAVDQSEEYDDCNPTGLRVGSERRDVEGWSADEKALEALLGRLGGYRKTVILSGDVHYGASCSLDYYPKGAEEPSRVLQLISSPAHNTFDRTVQAMTRTNALLQRAAGQPALERIAWKKASPIVLPPGEPVPLARLVRIKRSPALLLADGWPEGTTIPEGGNPDWAWRLALVRDERPNDALPTALRQPFLPASAEINELDPLPGYRALAARHSAAALTSFDHLRTVVFSANIGMVRIDADAEGFVLTHTLLSQDAPDSVSFAPNTVHRMRLEPSDDPAPALKIRDG